MRVRYRKLSAEFDAKGYLGEVQGAYQQAGQDPHEKSPLLVQALTDRPDVGNQLSAAAVTAVTAAVSQPSVVSAAEHEADLEEVRALLREGRLTGQDLVNLGQGWQAISDCIPLMDDVPQPGFDLGKAVLVVCVLGFLAALALLAVG